MKRKRPAKRKTKTHPDYAQCIVHIPHPLNNRINADAERLGIAKRDYVGQLLGQQSDAIRLPREVLAALDRFASQQHSTRDAVARLLIQRGLREVGAWG